MADYKLSQLTEKAALIATDIMHLRTVGAIDQKITGENLADTILALITDIKVARNTLDVNQGFQIIAKIANYVILDDDKASIIDMTTGAGDKTVTLPTAADNDNREITLRKADSGVGIAILDGEGAETINGTITWEVTEQYGYVTVKSDGTAWIVIAHEGCIYEMWDSGYYATSGAWVDKYNLPNISPGKYLIEFGVSLYTSADKQYATIATTVDTEDSAQYTVVCESANGGMDYMSKSFIRSFVAVTVLYLNAKTETNGAIDQQAGEGHGYIRATRIG